jgi:hypothetical protein
MTNLTASAKEAVKNSPVNLPSKPQVIEPSVEVLAHPRTVQEFLEGLDKGLGLAKQHKKYIERLKEIQDFKDVISDSSPCKMTIEHSSGASIIFPHLEIIKKFVNEQLENGREEVSLLEAEMKAFLL